MFKSILSVCLSKGLGAGILGAFLFAGLPVMAHAVSAGDATRPPQRGGENIPALFLPSSSATVAADSSKGFVRDRQVIRSRPVNIDRSLFDAAAGMRAGTQTIALNLFENVNFVAVADHIRHGERGITWVGHLRGVDKSNVVLILNGDIVSGNISMPMARYHIRFTGNGGHEVQRIDPRLFPRDEPFVPTPVNAAPPAAGDTARPGLQADDGSVIDVMVAYTATASAVAGGTGAINSLIDLAVAEANQSYQNSGVSQRLRLVHTEEVAYAETGVLQEALDCITKPADGCLDNLHALRDTYGADIVSLWVESHADGCGMAWFMNTVSVSFAASAFNVVARDCANGNYSFAHELGHNMGLMHDIYVDSTVQPYPYAHGYVNTSDAWRTIMAYDNACTAIGKTCERLQYWSNSSVLHNGAPMGDSASADDHRALNNTASVVANFRASVVPIGGSSPTVTEFYNINLDHYFITADSGEAGAIDNGSAGPGWIRTGGSFKSGGSTSVCRFYGSLSPGPNSHFYTADGSECAMLKDLQASIPSTDKRWNFESLDFASTVPVNQTCAAGTMPIYRAYNNGYARGVDSNHRISANLNAIQDVVNRGWVNEGVVMCAPL